MSADHPVSPEDIGRAGRGDVAALRRLRDFWLELADGTASSPLVPADEILPQLELLAELTASGSGAPEDWVALLVAYQIRVETLRRHMETSEGFAKQAADTENVADLDRWTGSVADIQARLDHYRAKMGALLSGVFNSTDANGPALLVTALSLQADRGDERAVPLLQSMMDSVTPQRAQAIQAEVRKMERATAQ